MDWPSNFERFWPEGEKSNAESLTKEFIDAPIRRRFLLGQNVYASSIIQAFDIAGVIDQKNSISFYPGVPLIDLTEVPGDAIVVNTAGGSPKSAKKILDNAGLVNIDYFAFSRFAGTALRDVVFNENFEEIFDENTEKFQDIFAKLADDESRKQFAKLISFRYTKNLAHLAEFENLEPFQYFESFLNFNSNEPSFLDVGGFDGQTSREFQKRFPRHGNILVMEPEVENFNRCIQEFSSDPSVLVVNAGAGAQKGKLKFSAGGSGSKVTEDGMLEVEIDTIDNLTGTYSISPDFIKMDIEGFEPQALRGAANYIRENCPTLAICVYHDPKHFWEIPEIVFELNNNYDLYLRHYTESIYETVMYFIPKSKG